MDVGGCLHPEELAAFVAAIESGTVGAAADALELTQSVASKRLAGLERRLGTTLCDRGRFGIRPTDAGCLLYPEAKQALAALVQAANVVTVHAAQAPTLRLAASPYDRRIPAAGMARHVPGGGVRTGAGRICAGRCERSVAGARSCAAAPGGSGLCWRG